MTLSTLPQVARPLLVTPRAQPNEGALARALRSEVRGDVLFDAASRGRYATDASIYQITPVGVVVPRDQADLRRALEVARAHKAAVLARGAGTSQCGQTVAPALVVDTSKWLNNVVDFDAEARTVTVEPGVTVTSIAKSKFLMATVASAAWAGTNPLRTNRAKASKGDRMMVP